MDSGPAQCIGPLDSIEFGLGPARARVGERDPGQPTTTQAGHPCLELGEGARLGVSPGAGSDPPMGHTRRGKAA
jgi:hypothetical protein